MEPSCPLPTTEGLISRLLRSVCLGPRPWSPPRCPASHLRGVSRGNGERSHPAGDGPRGTRDFACRGPSPPHPPWRRHGVAIQTPGARVGHRAENKGRLLSHPRHRGLWVGGQHRARTPGAGATRWRSRCGGAAVRAAMLLSRRAPGVFDACEAAPTPSAEASGSSPSTAAVTGEEGLGELAGATVLWAAGTECPLRRCRFPRHLPLEAADCAPRRLRCQ